MWLIYNWNKLTNQRDAPYDDSFGVKRKKIIMAKNAQNSRIEFTDLISLSGNLARYSPTGRDSWTAIGRPDGPDSPLIPDKRQITCSCIYK